MRTVIAALAVAASIAACSPQTVEVIREVPGPTVEVPGPTVEVPGPAYVPESCIDYMLMSEELDHAKTDAYNALLETGVPQDLTTVNRLLEAVDALGVQCMAELGIGEDPAPSGSVS